MRNLAWSPLCATFAAATMFALVVASQGCGGCECGAPKAAAPGTSELTIETIRALPYRCEAAAAQGEVARFRAGISAASGERLERLLANSRRALEAQLARAVRVSRVFAAAPAPRRQALAPVARRLDAGRQQARAFLERASWQTHLAAVARTPRATVARVVQLASISMRRPRLSRASS